MLLGGNTSVDVCVGKSSSGEVVQCDACLVACWSVENGIHLNIVLFVERCFEWQPRQSFH